MTGTGSQMTETNFLKQRKFFCVEALVQEHFSRIAQVEYDFAKKARIGGLYLGLQEQGSTVHWPWRAREQPGTDTNACTETLETPAAFRADQAVFDFGEQSFNITNLAPPADGGDISQDPRFKPWYAMVASGPKDIIIVLDISGSMNLEGRLQIAKDAAKTVMKTLSASDYFSVVVFSSGVWVPQLKLFQGTPANIKLVSDWVDGL